MEAKASGSGARPLRPIPVPLLPASVIVGKVMRLSFPICKVEMIQFQTHRLLYRLTNICKVLRTGPGTQLIVIKCLLLLLKMQSSPL